MIDRRKMAIIWRVRVCAEYSKFAAAVFESFTLEQRSHFCTQPVLQFAVLQSLRFVRIN